MVVAGIFLQQHFQYTLFLFSLSVLGLYLGTTSANGYFWSYFMMNGALMSMVAMTQPDITVYITVHRGAAITIGVLVSLVINVVFFPDYAHEILKRDFERHRMETFAWIREIIHQYLECEYHPDRVEGKYLELIRESGKIGTLLQDASTETKLLKGDPGALHALFKRISRRIEDFHAFYEGLPRHNPDPAYPENHRAAMTGLLENLDRLAKAEGWSLDAKDPVAEDIKGDLAALESAYGKTLSDEQKEAYGILDFLIFLELIYLLRRIVDDLTFKTREDSVSEVANLPESPLDERNSDLYRLNLLGRSRPIHIPTLKYAIKGALGIVCVFWF